MVHVHFNSTDQPSVTVDAELKPGFEVRGRVVDEQGRPVEDAIMGALYSGWRFMTQMNRSVTDADGSYQLGWYRRGKPLAGIRVKHDKFATVSKNGLVAPQDGDTTRWDFGVDKGFSISGGVTNEAGQAVEGANVRVRLKTRGPNEFALLGEVMTSDDGVASFPNLPLEQLRVICLIEGSEEQHQEVIKLKRNGDAVSVDFEVKKLPSPKEPEQGL